MEYTGCVLWRAGGFACVYTTSAIAVTGKIPVKPASPDIRRAHCLPVLIAQFAARAVKPRKPASTGLSLTNRKDVRLTEC
ncbi:hypothetical protein EN788_20535 [Mesorhizobium sp. M2D.F.Ca.ET.145.01.1.1]|nr:hypothetical protein EN803_22360 [Mesorhizobium sp. M2D.F.Ca.ET.160.01.1.1]TGW10249.1 hypothetical protein EN788_20535 [Mesorhizobium sp. M2D.F.Ca.ET.145.01.1.1]